MVSQEASKFELGLTEDRIEHTSGPPHRGHLMGKVQGRMQGGG
jgi:hypothetical protein